MLALILLTVIPVLRTTTANATTIYALTTLARAALGTFDLALLLILSAVFVPQWWANRRVLLAISAPYVLIILFIAADAIGRFGLIVNGIILKEGDYTFQTVQPGAALMLGLFAASWLPHIAILVLTFLRAPAMRPAIGVLLGALIFMIVLGVVETLLSIQLLGGSVVRIVPLMAALAYVVVFTQLIIPLPTAFEQVLHVMHEAVIVLPIIGDFDQPRSVEFSQVLLDGIAREHARLVLIDVTGMTLADQESA